MHINIRQSTKTQELAGCIDLTICPIHMYFVAAIIKIPISGIAHPLFEIHRIHAVACPRKR